MNCSKYLLAVTCIIAHNTANAQVPVIKEPHHKPVLVNDYVRLLDVHINPGDTTLYHVHAAPSVIVEISQSIIGIQVKDAAPGKPAEAIPGSTNFIAYDQKPVTHRVFNAGDNVFHVMDIELAKQEPSADSCNAIQQANVQTAINQKLVRVYKLDLNASQSLNIPKSSCAHLLIGITGSVISKKKIATGEFIFFKPNTAISISNDQPENSTCVLLELK